MKILPVLLCCAFFCQAQESFQKLVDENNHLMSHYERLYPFYNNFHAISSFDLSASEQTEIRSLAADDSGLSEDRDSVESYIMIEYLQERIRDNIYLLIEHPDFHSHDISKLLTSQELQVLVSSDQKVYNFVFDAKTGGTYRSMISIAYYTGFRNKKNIRDYQEKFNSDGYSYIYPIDVDGASKYLFFHDVRSCSYCFVAGTTLLSFENGEVSEDFQFVMETREPWSQELSFDPEKMTIVASYLTSDLTPDCHCESQSDGAYRNYGNFPVFENKCFCHFKFNGNTFEIADQDSGKYYSEDMVEEEILSFRIARNDKQVKLFLIDSDQLYYAFLQPDDKIELLYPAGRENEQQNFKLTGDGNSLFFENGGATYEIYDRQNASDERELGVVVTVGGKKYYLRGEPSDSNGSLSQLADKMLKSVSR